MEELGLPTGTDDTMEAAGIVTVTRGPPGPLAVVVLLGTTTVTDSVPWGVAAEPGLPEPGLVMVTVKRPGEPETVEEV